MNSKTYVCECGREFKNPQQFNGHKSRCKMHMMCCNKLDKLLLDENARHAKTKTTMQSNNEALKEIKRQQWLNEQHVCEHCGKIMTEKFASGRFCNRKCANSKQHSSETIERISQSMKVAIQTGKATPPVCNKLVLSEYRAKKYQEYKINPKLCIRCSTILSYNRKHCQYCADCLHIVRSEQMSRIAQKLLQNSDGNINRQGIRGTAKYGTYRDMPLDSSYELAFVVYCTENNIPIQRSQQHFEYTYKNKTRQYFPDFVINDCIIEIKKLLDSRSASKNRIYSQ